MKIAISGSHGLVGSALMSMFGEEGHEVIRLDRNLLYGETKKLASELKGIQVVIHLAGANINTRWTDETKKKIYDSRVLTTRNLVEAMGMMQQKPGVFICASAATIYPEAGSHTEKSNAVSHSFLGDLARDWEAEAAKARNMCRTLHLRIGMVLSEKGGALKTMLLPFKMGVGGKVGSGRQMISWIHIEDFQGIIQFCIKRKELSGAVNTVTPNPVNNAEFSHLLARTLNRPSFMQVPPFLLEALYGEGAQVVIRGVHAIPEKLMNAGFTYKFPQLEAALKDLLK